MIEPQETKEEKKIRTFAIVIDTSMSCSEEVIRGFLTETYEILISDELAEILGMSDRVLIMKDGQIKDERLRGDNFTQEKMIEVMV